MLNPVTIKNLIGSLRLPLFAFCATLFVAIAYTSVDSWIVPSRGWSDGLELLAQWLLILIGIFPWFYLLALDKRVFAIGYPLICVLSALLSFFRYTTGSVLTTMLLDAALGSGVQVVLDFLSWQLVLWLMLSLTISSLFVRFRWRMQITSPLLHLPVAMMLLIIMYSIPRLQRPMTERIPLNLLFVPIKYYEESRVIRQTRMEHTGTVSCLTEGDRPLVVLVLGESLRADHLSINGYQRETTPQLAREDVISLTNIYSPYTYTNPSIAHLLTRADSLHPDRADAEPSFIPLFSRAGYTTAWLANQEPTESYVYFMNECDTLIHANLDKSYYVYDKWTDDALLTQLDTLLNAKFVSSRGGLIILHTMGSHWYYDAHYTDEFERYRPTTKSRIVRANTPEEMINSYDNTILFTDDWLSRLISRLRQREVILIYQSDHGEALGENGVWLHASESAPAHHPAGLVWMSERYKAKYPHLYDRLKANKDRHYRTDYLFHTILEAGRIEAPQLEKEQSLFYSD